VVAALHRAGLVPRILSGTSAGSIVAAFVCVKTDSEMTDILFDDPEQVGEARIRFLFCSCHFDLLLFFAYTSLLEKLGTIVSTATAAQRKGAGVG
jgi:hypothetical protein